MTVDKCFFNSENSFSGKKRQKLDAGSMFTSIKQYKQRLLPFCFCLKSDPKLMLSFRQCTRSLSFGISLPARSRCWKFFVSAAHDLILPDITNIAGDRLQRQAFHITNPSNIKAIRSQWKYGLCFNVLAKVLSLSRKAS